MFDERFLQRQRLVAADHGKKKKKKKVGIMCVDYRLNDYADQLKALLDPLFTARVPAGLVAEKGSGVPCLIGVTLNLLDPELVVVIMHDDCAALAAARNEPDGPVAKLFREYGLAPGISDRDYAKKQLSRVRETVKPGVQVAGLFVKVNGVPLIFRDGEYVTYRTGEPLF